MIALFNRKKGRAFFGSLFFESNILTDFHIKTSFFLAIVYGADALGFRCLYKKIGKKFIFTSAFVVR